jgi:hypothetical protein
MRDRTRANGIISLFLLLLAVTSCSTLSGGDKLVNAAEDVPGGIGIKLVGWPVISLGNAIPFCVEGSEPVRIVDVSWEEDHGVQITRFGLNKKGISLGSASQPIDKLGFVPGPGSVVALCDRDELSQLAIEVSSSNPSEVTWSRGLEIHYVSGDGPERALTQMWTVALCPKSHQGPCDFKAVS